MSVRPLPVPVRPSFAHIPPSLEGAVTLLRVAELLKVRPADVARIAEGRVGLSSPAWQRVLAEIDA
jgi:hypothetical protein